MDEDPADPSVDDGGMEHQMPRSWALPPVQTAERARGFEVSNERRSASDLVATGLRRAFEGEDS